VSEGSEENYANAISSDGKYGGLIPEVGKLLTVEINGQTEPVLISLNQPTVQFGVVMV